MADNSLKQLLLKRISAAFRDLARCARFFPRRVFSGQENAGRVRSLARSLARGATGIGALNSIRHVTRFPDDGWVRAYCSVLYGIEERRKENIRPLEQSSHTHTEATLIGTCSCQSRGKSTMHKTTLQLAYTSDIGVWSRGCRRQTGRFEIFRKC